MALALTTMCDHLLDTAKTHLTGTAFALVGLAVFVRFLYNLYFYRSLARGLVSMIYSSVS